jgi:uncharacterized membrane protein
MHGGPAITWHWTRPGGAQLALSAIAVAFLLAATWLGGKLTYYHGIRVTGQAGHQDGASRRR